MSSRDVLQLPGLDATPVAAGGGKYFVTNLVMLAHEDDCERIAKAHVKKNPLMTPTMGDSVISTVDNAKWRKLRESLGVAFMPNTNLAPIFDVSVARAEAAVQIMAGLAGEGGAEVVDASEFFLHEAQAQLQLALFGMDQVSVSRAPSARAGRALFTLRCACAVHAALCVRCSH